ncbi:hypothetical protein DDE05_49830 [Streptomyces cavourensis]|nr:hypothetical protein DDE05_49830 [Streptomyces cavourensis]
MTLDQIMDSAVRPAMALLPARMDSRQAHCLLLAIGLQESRFIHRRQIGGPARGFWQFEQGGGVRGVLTHPACRDVASQVCQVRGVVATAPSVHARLDQDDVLAAAFARLLLWSDPASLPRIGDAESAWALYLRTWRPGKPKRDSWDGLYQRAVAAVSAPVARSAAHVATVD